MGKKLSPAEFQKKLAAWRETHAGHLLEISAKGLKEIYRCPQCQDMLCWNPDTREILQGKFYAAEDPGV